jgi:hypothetical protein
MSEVMALLIMLKGDVLTLTELEKFSDMESCAKFAKAEYPAALAVGNSGIGCASYKYDGQLEMKLIGVMKWRKP